MGVTGGYPGVCSWSWFLHFWASFLLSFIAKAPGWFAESHYFGEFGFYFFYVHSRNKHRVTTVFAAWSRLGSAKSWDVDEIIIHVTSVANRATLTLRVCIYYHRSLAFPYYSQSQSSPPNPSAAINWNPIFCQKPLAVCSTFRAIR